jgi:hypothetical protein
VGQEKLNQVALISKKARRQRPQAGAGETYRLQRSQSIQEICRQAPQPASFRRLIVQGDFQYACEP